MGIGKKMEENVQLQHLTELCLSVVFNRIINEDYELIDEMCENLGVTYDEMMWAFEQLGCDRSTYVDEDVWETVEDIDEDYDFVDDEEE